MNSKKLLDDDNEDDVGPPAKKAKNNVSLLKEKASSSKDEPVFESAISGETMIPVNAPKLRSSRNSNANINDARLQVGVQALGTFSGLFDGEIYTKRRSIFSFFINLNLASWQHTYIDDHTTWWLYLCILRMMCPAYN